MAIINVALSDTFDQWRTKTNTLGTNQGDLANLDAGFAGSDLVSCLNELRAGEEFTKIDIADSTNSAGDGPSIRIGDGDDLLLYHDGNNSVINATNLKIQNAATTRVEVTSSGATITGALTLLGDNIILTTNTAGHIMVANGTQYVPLAVSGDATLAANGTLTVANGAITGAKIADGSITGGDIAADTIGASNIANGSITSTEFSSPVTLNIKNSSGTVLKTLRSPGS